MDLKKEAIGVRDTGSLNLGGSIATAGGLVFIGASNDHRFRAFDSKTGKELWHFWTVPDPGALGEAQISASPDFVGVPWQPLPLRQPWLWPASRPRDSV